MVRTALLAACAGLQASHSFANVFDGVALIQAAVGLHSTADEDKPQEPGTYAYTSYAVGEAVEGRMSNGSWIPATIIGTGSDWGLYNVHVSDDFPGYDLPNVPFQLLRKVLAWNESDYLVDNSRLQHRGAGVKYRFSKNLNQKSEEYAPWGTLVVGSDEGDGWIKTARGYLPTKRWIHNILVQKERTGSPRAPRPEVSLSVSSAPMYESGEHAEFLTKKGDYYPCRIKGQGSIPKTFNIIVQPDEFTVFPVSNVPLKDLRKAQSTERMPLPNEPIACKKDGCILLKVHQKTKGSVDHKDFLVQVPKRSKLDMMMKMVCNRLRIDWGNCQEFAEFTFKGEKLNPTTHLMESGLQDEDVVDLSTPAEITTYRANDKDDQVSLTLSPPKNRTAVTPVSTVVNTTNVTAPTDDLMVSTTAAPEEQTEQEAAPLDDAMMEVP